MPENETNGEENIGTVRSISINEEMRGSYLDYAMSVIVARALPDARDGLKPVHRRILYAMYDMGLRPQTPYKKSARIVGEVLGKYHPHGDSAVYDAMARMAQDFSLRYPLVDGQGNFGSVDGDSPAAMRYTEARMAQITIELLQDIHMNTVNFTENYDGSQMEPEVLPARLPNLLLNGTSGIAVGMATNIPPHNLRELIQAITYIIDNYESLDDITIEDLMQFVKGPDFPTGAEIAVTDDLKEAYATGKGRVAIRATYDVEEGRNGLRLVFRSIPYQVSKSGIIERIVGLVREGRIETIRDLRDESDRQGMRLVVELKSNTSPHTVANQLYKYTQLQTYYSIQMLALVNGEPRNLSLKRALSIYIEHRYDVIVRRTQFELEKQRARAHILIGLLKAVSDIDAVIRAIRSADDVEDARQKLMSFFELSEPQANAILDMQLRRLAALERQKLQDEYDEVQARIAYLEELLGDPHMILQVIRQDVTEIAEHYGDSRRTRVADFETDLDESDLHQDEKVIISLTHRGYIKRVPLRMYKEQRRGGRGVKGMETRDEDFLLDVFFANSKDTVLFFSNRGKVYSAPAYRIPEAGRAQKGTIIHTVLNMSTDEQITAVMPIRDFSNPDATVVMATRHGRIKRVPLEEFADVRNAGLIATFLHEGDTLNWVKYSDGNQHVILVTEHGQSIRFPETEVRVMGRMAGGVNAIRLMEDDVVAGMDILQSDLHTHILVVTENGYGKRTPIDQYNTQSRYGLGSRTLARNERTGKIIAMRCINKDDSIMILSRGGIIIRTKLAQIRETGRSTMGVTVMNLTGVDQVVGIAIFNDDEDDEIPVDSGTSTGEAPGEVVNDGLPPEAENGTITES